MLQSEQSYTLREVSAEVFVDKKVILIRVLMMLYHIQVSKCVELVGKIVWK